MLDRLKYLLGNVSQDYDINVRREVILLWNNMHYEETQWLLHKGEMWLLFQNYIWLIIY